LAARLKLNKGPEAAKAKSLARNLGAVNNALTGQTHLQIHASYQFPKPLHRHSLNTTTSNRSAYHYSKSRNYISTTMAQTSLTQEDIKALEHTRQRLYQLSNNIASLKGDVLRSNPLPQW